MTLGVYEITYQNGMKQQKNLIEHDDYLNVVVPARDKIHQLELAKQKKQADVLKQQLIDKFGEHWFTNKSPLYGAFTSGMLVQPEIQGGTTHCNVRLVSE